MHRLALVGGAAAVLILSGPMMAQAPRPSFNGAFYLGFSYREDLSLQVTGRLMAGFEAAVGGGDVQPTLGVFVGGRQPNSIDVGVKALASRGTSGHYYWGIGGAAYSTVDFRAFGRLGYESTTRESAGFRAELRIYGPPFEPGLFAAIVLPATRR